MKIKWINPPPGSGRPKYHVEEADPFLAYLSTWLERGWVEVVKEEKPALAIEEKKAPEPATKTRAIGRAPKK